MPERSADASAGRLAQLHAALDASADGVALYDVLRDDAGRSVQFRLDFLNAAARANEHRVVPPLVPAVAGPRVVADRTGVGTATATGLLTALQTAVEADTPHRFHTARDGGLRPPGDADVVFEDTAVLLPGDQVLVTWHDVTKLQSSYEALRAAYAEVRGARRQLRNALDAAAEGFAIYRAERDATGSVRGLVLTYVNEHGATLLGGSTPRLQDFDLRELVSGEDVDQLWAAALEVLESGETVELSVGLSTGPRRIHGEFDHVVSRLSADELVIAFRDVTDERQQQEALEHAATHDALTGLPNRTLLRDRIEQALLQRQERGEAVAVAFLDLDRFKDVNDRYGHAAGDHYLQEAATRIRASLRDADTLARLGGDEFVAVLRDIHDVASVLAWYERLQHALAQPVDLGSDHVPVQASVGVAVATHGGTPPLEADLMLRAADQAMYAAKQAGRGRLEVVAVPPPPRPVGADEGRTRPPARGAGRTIGPCAGPADLPTLPRGRDDGPADPGGIQEEWMEREPGGSVMGRRGPRYLAVLLLGIAAVLLPVVGVALPVNPSFLPVVMGAVILTAALTARLLKLQFRQFGRMRLLVAAQAFWWTVITQSVAALTIPGVVTEEPLLGGPDSGAWLLVVLARSRAGVPGVSLPAVVARLDSGGARGTPGPLRHLRVRDLRAACGGPERDLRVGRTAPARPGRSRRARLRAIGARRRPVAPAARGGGFHRRVVPSGGDHRPVVHPQRGSGPGRLPADVPGRRALHGRLVRRQHAGPGGLRRRGRRAPRRHGCRVRARTGSSPSAGVRAPVGPTRRRAACGGHWTPRPTASPCSTSTCRSRPARRRSGS